MPDITDPLKIQIDATQVDKGTKSLKDLAAAGAGAEAQAKKLNAAHAALLDTLKAGGAINSKMIQEAGGWAAAQKIIADASKASTTASTASAAAAGAAGAGMKAAGAAAAGAAKGFDMAKLASAGVTRELVVLAREAGRGNLSQMVGSTSLLAQRLGLLTPAVILTGGAIAGLAAVVAGMAFVMFKGAEEVAKFNGSLIATGNYAGLTAGSLETMSRAIAKSSDTTIGSTKATVVALVETGKFSGAAVASLADAAQNYSRITHENAEKFVEEYKGMGQNIVQFAVQHEAVYHDLTLQQVEQIDWLQKHGKAKEALDRLAADIDAASKKRLQEATKDAADNFGFLQKAMHAVSITASEMWDAILGLGRPKTLDQQITAAAGDVTRLATALKAASAGGYSQTTRDALQGELHTALANMRGLQGRAQAQATGAASAAATAAANHNAIQAKFGSGKATGPQDDTARRLADLDKQVAQAKVEELQAQLSLTHDTAEQGVLQQQIIAAQGKIKDAEIARQIATVNNDKGLSAATKAQIVGQLQAVQATGLHITALQQQAAAEKTAAELSKEALRNQTAGFQNAVDLLSAQATLTHSTKEQGDLALRILALRQDAEVATQQQITAENGYGAEEVAAAQRRLAILKQLAPLQTRAQIEANAAALEREALVHAQAALQNQEDILQAQAGLAKSSYARWQIENRLVQLQLDQERLAQEQMARSSQSSPAQKAEAEARIKTIDELKRLATPKPVDDLLHAYSSADDALSGLSNALKSHDWATAWTSLAAAIETLKAAFAQQGNAMGQAGAVAGVANAAGQIIGGGVGNVIKSTVGGALAGAAVAGPIGAAIGWTVGLVGGLLGNAKKKAEAEAQKAQAEAQRQQQIAEQHRSLEIRLATAQNNAIAALNMQRNDEIASVDATNQALLKQVYAAEDAAALESKRRELTIRLLQAQGKAEEALAMQRQDEMKALQPELRDLQAMVYIRQDEADAAQKATQQTQQRLSLEGQYYTAIGEAAQATAVQREAEIAALDDTLKPLQRAVYAAEDWAAAIQKVNDAVADAVSKVDAQISAAQSQADAAHQSAQAYKDAADSMRDALLALRTGDLTALSPAQQLFQSRSALNTAFSGTMSGDLSAFGQLPGLAQDYLSAFRGQASSSSAYAREFARIAVQLQQAQTAAGAFGGHQDYVATLLDAEVGILKDIKENLSQPDPNTDLLKQQTSLLAGIGAILQTQTGQLTFVGGALVDQTGAVVQGNSVADAIRNITAIDAGYTAQMVQALVNSANSQAGGFSAMMQGLNSVVAVLHDVAVQLGSKSAPPPSLPDNPATPVSSAFDQARAALLGGDLNAAQRYLNANPDVAYRYAHPTGSAGDVNPVGGEDILSFALRHFRLAGQFEAFSDHGRNLFAAGGAFTNGVVSRPTAFNIGLMGEIGPEGVLPLANVGGRLGVYASNDNSAAQEIRALRSVIERLETRLSRIEANTGRSARSAESLEHFGIYAHGEKPGDPVETEAA